mmetsp:Transcript_37832/g.106971  ORF Transcript_37832/g.106971 Transcript_37832/m.106971 type:complete len:201 (-) Transcript_37832:336-938(-)
MLCHRPALHTLRARLAAQEPPRPAEVLFREPGADSHGQPGGRAPARERVDHFHRHLEGRRRPALQVPLGRGGGVDRRPVARPAVHRADVEVLQHEHSQPARGAGQLLAVVGDEIADGAQPHLGGDVGDECRRRVEREASAQAAEQHVLELPPLLRVPRVPPRRREDHGAAVARHLDELRQAAHQLLAGAQGGRGLVLGEG